MPRLPSLALTRIFEDFDSKFSLRIFEDLPACRERSVREPGINTTSFTLSLHARTQGTRSACLYPTAPPARRPGGHSERHAYWRGNEPARAAARRSGRLARAGGGPNDGTRLTGAERGEGGQIFQNLPKNCLCGQRFASSKFASTPKKSL